MGEVEREVTKTDVGDKYPNDYRLWTKGKK